eukprot:1901366-Pleurochrysis_carterae.AAC.2
MRNEILTELENAGASGSLTFRSLSSNTTFEAFVCVRPGFLFAVLAAAENANFSKALAVAMRTQLEIYNVRIENRKDVCVVLDSPQPELELRQGIATGFSSSDFRRYFIIIFILLLLLLLCCLLLLLRYCRTKEKRQGIAVWVFRTAPPPPPSLESSSPEHHGAVPKSSACADGVVPVSTPGRGAGSSHDDVGIVVSPDVQPKPPPLSALTPQSSRPDLSSPASDGSLATDAGMARRFSRRCTQLTTLPESLRLYQHVTSRRALPASQSPTMYPERFHDPRIFFHVAVDARTQRRLLLGWSNCAMAPYLDFLLCWHTIAQHSDGSYESICSTLSSGTLRRYGMLSQGKCFRKYCKTEVASKSAACVHVAANILSDFPGGCRLERSR